MDHSDHLRRKARRNPHLFLRQQDIKIVRVQNDPLVLRLENRIPKLIRVVIVTLEQVDGGRILLRAVADDISVLVPLQVQRHHEAAFDLGVLGKSSSTYT